MVWIGTTKKHELTGASQGRPSVRRGLALLICAVVGVVSGCSRKGESDIRIDAPKDLVGRKCAVVVGSMMGDMTQQIEPGIRIEWFNDYNSGIEAVRLGKVEAVPLDLFFARRWAQLEPNAFAITRPYHSIPWGFFFAKGSPLRGKVDAVLRKMRASGDLDRIIAKWGEAADSGSPQFDALDDRPDFTGRAGTLRFATPGDREPISYTRTDGTVGFDIDIVRRIAYELDMKLELVRVTMGGLVPAVQSGKADMGGGGIAITAERAETVDFADCYYRVPTVFLIRRSSLDGGNAAAPIRSAADLKGRHVAHMSSDFHKKELEALQPDIVFDPYSEYSFAFESLRKGKIDAISIGKSYADIWMAKFAGEFRIAFEYADDVCCFLLSKNSPLKQKFDVELRKMNAAGETIAIARKWIDGAKAGKPPAMPEFPVPPNGAPEVRLACAAQAEPWCFVSGDRFGGLVGADIEIVRTVAQRLGWNLKPKVYSWGGMVDCVNAGRCEIACGGIYTAGREFPTVDASEKYADEKMCLLVRNEGFKGGDSGLVAFAKSLKASFVRTFVTEDRWKMLADGFGVTLLITFLSALFGTALAFPVWWTRTSRVRLVSSCAKSYIAVLQGTPVLVLLMVLFYIVFGKVDIGAIWVAVIGFGLNLSAYAGEMLRSGVDSVPRGQVEAALALGYSSRRAFFRFVLPQAVRTVLPVYRGELIGLLKMTSVVGYIAIGDLTKASDLVRSRTYESFFPIITTALIYFVASWLLAVALERFGRRLDPAFGRRRKGGVA